MQTLSNFSIKIVVLIKDTMIIEMSDIQEKHYNQIKSFIERNQWSSSEKPEDTCKRIDVMNGKFKSCVKIYRTGTIQIQ